MSARVADQHPWQTVNTIGCILGRAIDPYARAALAARKVIGSLGLKVTRIPRGSLGIDAFADMHHLAVNKRSPVIIDAGTNIGQSVHRFKHSFPDSHVHAFEPSPTTYRRLCENVRRYPGVYTSNSGLGATAGEATLLENSHPDMSSFLLPSRLAWGEIASETIVALDTVDDYAERVGLGCIEILKSDTQGFDLEVIKGASRLIDAGRIHMVYMELIFSEMYEGIPPCDEVMRYLFDHGYQLVCFYDFHFQENVAGWSDALFVNRSFCPKGAGAYDA